MKTHPVAVFYGKFRSISALAVAAALLAVIFLYSPTSESKTALQPTALGKLSYDKTTFTTSGFGYISIFSSNSDGSNENGLAAAAVPPIYNINSSWSADGTKIVYETDGEIWKMNSDGTGKVNLTNNGNVTGERNPAWSPSGKIAYERNGQIWLMNEDGTAQAAFASISQPAPTAPAWSLDGSKLAFVSGGNIWVINANGSGESVVTNNGAANADPAFSPDGTKILFTRSGSGIATINTNGTGEVLLTNNAQDGKPAISSDGTKIAFVRRGTAVNGIYTMDAVGGNQLCIRSDNPTNPGRTEHDNPAWQPVALTPNTSIISGRILRNGESLAGVTVNIAGSVTSTTTTNSLGEYRFENLAQSGSYTITPSLASHIFTPIRRIFVDPTSNRIADFAGGQSCFTTGCKLNGRLVFVRGTDILISNADGSGVTNLTNGTMGICEEPAFSPDGSSITFRSNSPGNYEIYRMNASGGGITRLTNSAGSDETPVYSPDGTKIVFVSDRDGDLEIYAMNANDGSNIQQLTVNTIRDSEPSFSPDGTKIVFNRSTNGNFGPWQVYTMNSADGSSALQITSPAANFLDMTPSYSPDGTKIIFTRYDTGPFTSVFMTVNTDGTGPTTLPLSGFIRKASYAPDGTKIVYTQVGLSGQPSRLWIYSLAGGSTQLIVDGYNADWQPIRPAVRTTPFDLDGDGRADLSVFRPSDRIWYQLNSTTGFTAFQWGLGTDTIVPADYDGDQKTDLAVWRPTDGNFYIVNSSNSTIKIDNFGLSGDVPTPQDWDGDAKADISVYRPGAQGTFYYRGSSANPNGNTTYVPWGLNGDKPVMGDYDGDSLADAAVFRPSSGVWYVRKSSDGQLNATQFGLANDKLVPADYDGDSRTDLAVFRDGIWYLWRSTEGFQAFQYGLVGDRPVPADFDGDGRADAGIYRSGIWYVLKSTGGNIIGPFGLADDKPLPNAYVR